MDHARENIASEVVGAEAVGAVGRAEAAREIDIVGITGEQGRTNRDQHDHPDIEQRDESELAPAKAAPHHLAASNRILGSANAYSTSARRPEISVMTAVATVSPRTVG